MLTEFSPASGPTSGPDSDAPVHPMRALTQKVAFGQRWTPQDVELVSGLFDSMADDWTARHDLPERYAPLADALDRVDLRGGVCVELGSGTGLGTRHLQDRFDAVIALDLAMGMLKNAPPELGSRVQGDSNRLPIRDASVDVVVLVNMLLFPHEIDRILAPSGTLVWVNTMAESTPIHLSPEEVHDALPGDWTVAHARVGSGLWAAATRA